MPAQPQGARAVPGEFGAVAQGAVGPAAGGAQPAGQLLGPDPVAECGQLGGQVAEFDGRRVGGEGGVELGRGVQGGQPPVQGVEDAFGGGGQPVGAAGSFLQQVLAAGGERVVDLGAPVGELLAEGRVGVGEAGLQLLDPQQQPAELVVAGLGGVGGGERGGGGLGEQGRLGGELGGGLAGAQLPAAHGECGPGPVEQAEHVGEPVQDRGAGGGVGQVEGADQLRDGLQRLALGAQFEAQRLGLGGGGDGGAGLGQFGGPAPVRGEGGGLGELADGPAGRLREAFGEVRGERVDPLRVGARQVA